MRGEFPRRPSAAAAVPIANHPPRCARRQLRTRRRGGPPRRGLPPRRATVGRGMERHAGADTATASSMRAARRAAQRGERVAPASNEQLLAPQTTSTARRCAGAARRWSSASERIYTAPADKTASRAQQVPGAGHRGRVPCRPRKGVRYWRGHALLLRFGRDDDGHEDVRPVQRVA